MTSLGDVALLTAVDRRTQGDRDIVARRTSTSLSDDVAESADYDAPAREGKARAGGRAVAQPLAASWDPEVDGETRAHGHASRPVRVLLTYALPLLIVLTVVAALDVARPSASSPSNPGGTVGQQPASVAPAPTVTERMAFSVSEAFPVHCNERCIAMSPCEALSVTDVP